MAEGAEGAPGVEALEAAVLAAQEATGAQGDAVRALKAEVKTGAATKEQVAEAIARLKELKAAGEAAMRAFEAAMGGSGSSALNREAFREKVINALERRMFYVPSFKIYGGVGGLYDFGPPGCSVKNNMIQFWRRHFILEENMLEVECSAIAPEPVLKASGHVERFLDFMVMDEETKDCHRADHILQAALEKLLATPLQKEQREAIRDTLARLDELKVEELGAELRKYDVKAPETGNPITDPFPFNLMFSTSIGPKGDLKGYLRPETAQGIFVNFRDLLYYNGGKLPFGAAQIGQSYRNEISPKAGLLRVREFTQCEIEHFFHPDIQAHPRYGTVADLELNLYPRAEQLGKVKKPVKMTLRAAAEKRVITNEILAYFIGRTHMFMLAVGIDPARLRFRQHLQHEMAHYAQDCWDAEVECSYGWVECVGLADRSAFDLKAHTAGGNTELVAWEQYDEPETVEVWAVKPEKKFIAKELKKETKAVTDALEALTGEEAQALQEKLEAEGSAELGGFTVAKEMVTIKKTQKKISGRNFTPSVIEPSFGIGRIMYCMFEHTFYTREGDDEARTVFRFTPLVAPIKVAVFPLLRKDELDERAGQLHKSLLDAGISSVVDTTGVSIGKRYARTDELGVSFACTVDHTTLTDGTVTLRERDSTEQIRCGLAQVPALVAKLLEGSASWAELQAEGALEALRL